MSRYVIIGAGAIGAPVAAQLRSTGVGVVLVARGAHRTAIATDGLRYVRPEGERRIKLPVAGSAAEVDLTVGDVLVLATKTQDTEAVLAEWSWRPVTGGTTAAESLPLISLQNGLDNERVALRRFARTSGAAVQMPSSYLRPGEVVAPGDPVVGAFYLGGYPGGLDPDAEVWATDLRRSGFAVRLVDDLPRWKAGKLINNVVNPVDALYAGHERFDDLAEALQAEARRVVEKAGFDPADLSADPDMRVGLSADLMDRYGGSSTRQSLGKGAGATEADFLNGEIVLLGRLHGVPTPLNAAMQAAVARAARDGVPPGGGDPALPDALLGTTEGTGR
ncbi:ketopantoate reductase family protein [Cryptosporangium phraense]|uniref:ketopantoate reductase family protein n=1 Tax=Cryptosporangium phraense TaxID=2593070 RepID=UPI0014783611|nr:ketopantoate reductase family protein [Cryptosporangium phraense]